MINTEIIPNSVYMWEQGIKIYPQEENSLPLEEPHYEIHRNFIPDFFTKYLTCRIAAGWRTV
jgi:hypothetical protein